MKCSRCSRRAVVKMWVTDYSGTPMCEGHYADMLEAAFFWGFRIKMLEWLSVRRRTNWLKEGF
jgi:hypothetical protein